jgi:chromosome segregation ATPase
MPGLAAPPGYKYDTASGSIAGFCTNPSCGESYQYLATQNSGLQDQIEALKDQMAQQRMMFLEASSQCCGKVSSLQMQNDQFQGLRSALQQSQAQTAQLQDQLAEAARKAPQGLSINQQDALIQELARLRSWVSQVYPVSVQSQQVSHPSAYPPTMAATMAMPASA